MPNFAGKVALVTGGTSGIGRATAIAFAKEGASVLVAGRRQEEGEETARLVKNSGGQGVFIETDVTQEADVQAMVEKAIATFDRLDVLENCSTRCGMQCGLSITFIALRRLTFTGFAALFCFTTNAILTRWVHQKSRSF